MADELKYVPGATSDILMHVKDGEFTERYVLPFTRYQNILFAPKVVNENSSLVGAPFHLLAQEEEYVDVSFIRKHVGAII